MHTAAIVRCLIIHVPSLLQNAVSIVQTPLELDSGSVLYQRYYLGSVLSVGAGKSSLEL